MSIGQREVRNFLSDLRRVGCSGQSARRDERNCNQSADEQREYAENETGYLAAIYLRLAGGAHDANHGADNRGYGEHHAQPHNEPGSGWPEKESGIGKQSHQCEQQSDPCRPVALARRHLMQITWLRQISCWRHMKWQSSKFAVDVHGCAAARSRVAKR